MKSKTIHNPGQGFSLVGQNFAISRSSEFIRRRTGAVDDTLNHQVWVVRFRLESAVSLVL
jgi:hypothetical protein